MTDFICPTREKPYMVEHGPDHRSEYFFEHGVQMVRETMRDRVLERTIDEALTESPWVWLKAFYGSKD